MSITGTDILRSAYVIGQQNFDSWSQGFDAQGYLKVLPHPDVKVAFKDPFRDWQLDNPQGNYYSSWGPNKELNVTLTMSELGQVDIGGFGILKSGDGLVPWLDNKATPYEQLRGYNSLVPGPMLITEPGDTLNLTVINDLDQVANLHTHGLHVSPLGDGDNVLVAVNPGDTLSVSIKIPDDHFIGQDWYHPHLHGLTNEQVSSGLAGQLLILPPYDLPDLNKFNPKTEPFFTFALNTFGIQEIPRLTYDADGQAIANPNDPLNTTTIPVPAATPLEVLGVENGQKVYQLSDAPFIGYNGKSTFYDPAFPAGNPDPFSFPYGGGLQSAPVENVIHTVNGQYNPTLDLTTGDWNLFTFTNMNSNAFHILQLVKDTGTALIPQDLVLVSLDGDAAGVVEDNRRIVTELPLLNPGSRIAVQKLFTEPGKYYLLSNGTEALLGDNAPSLIKGHQGFEDGHLIWGSQVLATFEVAGDVVTDPPPFPEAYDILKEQAAEIDALIQSALGGDVDRERTFVWSANPGRAFQEFFKPPVMPGPPLDDANAGSFEGTYQINGAYFSQSFSKSQVPLAMPMLGTKEVWTIKNASGQLDPNLPPQLNIPLQEWHPFHIHQNDFTVLEVNGIPTSELTDQYLAGVLRDTIALPPAYAPGSVSVENPYGTPAIGFDPAVAPPGAPVSEASTIKILMDFQDYPGNYVNHCHILFHEDAGMMAPVRVILNTEDTWLGLGSKTETPGTVDLFKANNFQGLSLKAYGNNFSGGGIEVAIGDVNYKPVQGQPLSLNANQNVTDNVTDIVTIQRSLNFRDRSNKAGFTVKVFDGQTLINQQTAGQTTLDGTDQSLLLKEFTPFKGFTLSSLAQTSIATGDINGDGFSDIVVGLAGGSVKPLIEIYSGEDYHLMARIAPFHHETDFKGTINLATGDVDGDNYSDIIVGQGDGGEGLAEVYSGLLIQEHGSSDGKETAHHTELLSWQPYGDSYTGGVKVTSGYVLQAPEIQNEAAIQTYHANITTLAMDDVGQQETVKIFTYIGGGHDHTAMEPTAAMDMDMTAIPDTLRLDKAFTPTQDLVDVSGTFADIPEQLRGQGVLFSRTQGGDYELIHLQEGRADLAGNTPEYISPLQNQFMSI